MVTVKKIILSHIIFLIAGFLLAQDPYVSLEIEPTNVDKGVPVSITIKSNVDGNLEFDLPSEFVQSGGMHSGMSSSVNYQSGKGVVEKYSFQKFSGYFNATGEYEIGPVKLKTADGELVSSSVKVKVAKPMNMISENPENNMDKALFGIIQQSKKEVYEGEPVVVEAKVYAQVDVLQVENFSPFKFEGPAEIQKLGNNRQVTQKFEKINDKDVLTFKVGKSLIFPEQSGTFELSPFEMLLFYDDPRRMFPERAKVRSNESLIKVKPLPKGAPKNFIGGVGQFGVKAKFADTKVDQGKVAELCVTINGKGNLHNIEPPKLMLPKGMVLYGDPEVDSDLKFTSFGAEGSKSFRFFIQANQAGDVFINPISISFFNPVTERYETVSTKKLMLDVKPDEKFEPLLVENEDVETFEKEELRSFIVKKESNPNRGEDLYKGLTASLLGAPLALALLIGFFVKYNKDNEEKRTDKKVKKSAINKAVEQIRVLKSNNASLSDAEFYSKLEQTLNTFLTVKWDVNEVELTKEYIKNKQISGDLSSSQVKKIIDFYNSGDKIKYSGGGLENDREDILNNIRIVIEEIQQNLKI